MLDDLLLGKLAAVESRSEELSAKLSDPEILARPPVMQKLAKEHSDIRELVDTLDVALLAVGDVNPLERPPRLLAVVADRDRDEPQHHARVCRLA